jgi:hypothetical protein
MAMAKAKRWDQKVKLDWFKEPRLAVFEKHSEFLVKCKICSSKTVAPVLLNVKSHGKAILATQIATEKHLQLVEEGVSGDSDPTQSQLENYISKRKQVSTFI